MGRKPDTVEEAEIREEIKKRKLDILSPRMVLRIPKAEIEPLVMNGLVDREISRILKVSEAVINRLRKYYDLPNYYQVQEMLACITPSEAPLDDPDKPSIEEALKGETVEDVPTYTATEGDEVEPESLADPIPKQDIINLVM
ncbi:MAG: hypothetical protein QME74_10420, partial [Candidatus Edwardsbacteria bacterium]|nr:hypothetical protein [Candidatus Edwardsbacteria bacterium]